MKPAKISQLFSTLVLLGVFGKISAYKVPDSNAGSTEIWAFVWFSFSAKAAINFHPSLVGKWELASVSS